MNHIYHFFSRVKDNKGMNKMAKEILVIVRTLIQFLLDKVFCRSNELESI